MNIAGSEMEVLSDFRKALEKIDFEEYNPRSEDFENAMFVGLMWLLLKHLSDEEGGHQWAEDIMEEMEGARKYLDCYEKSGEEMYKKMAGDELHHAEMLIEHHLATNPGKNVWIEAVLAEHSKMKAVLETHGKEHEEARAQLQPASAMAAGIGNASRG